MAVQFLGNIKDLFFAGGSVEELDGGFRFCEVFSEKFDDSLVSFAVNGGCIDSHRERAVIVFIDGFYFGIRFHYDANLHLKIAEG